MATLFQRHCSDEALICHLDGELPFYKRRSVRLHLHKCWKCRLRLSEIETQVLEATRSMQQDAFPGPQRTAEARLKFLASADSVAEQVFGARKQAKATIGWRLAWAAACVAVIGLFILWEFTGREPAPGAAAEVVNRVQSAEEQAARAPAHQRFRVVARQLRPAAGSRESRLELWSDPGRGRFTTRFSDGTGFLRHAVWQPAPGRQFVYRARTAQVVSFSRREAEARWDGILLRDGLTLEDLEAGLLTWLENRPWRPVSFASGIAVLATADGAALSVEEIRSDSGQRLIRLRAGKRAGSVTVEFTLDVNERTYKPELQSIRYESPARTLELRLYSEPAGPVMPVSFEPPASLTKTTPAPASLPPAIRADVQRLPAAPDTTLLEVEIHYALHRIRACVDEAPEVNRRPGGILNVRAAVASPERKAQLLAALAPFAGPQVTLDIKSADEILREISPETVTVVQGAQVRASDRGELIRRLSRYFAGREADAREFVDKVLSAGEGLMQDAQALRHLAERFGGRAAVQSPRTQVLLDLMYEEHLRDLEQGIRSTLLTLGPVLGGAAIREERLPVSGEGWDSESLRIFGMAKKLNDTLRHAFTGEHSGFNEERFASEIRDAVAPLQSRVRAASEAAASKARRAM